MHTEVEQISTCKVDGDSQISHSWKGKATGYNELYGTRLLELEASV